MAGKQHEIAFLLTARSAQFQSSIGQSASVLSSLQQRTNIANTAMSRLDAAFKSGKINAAQHGRSIEMLTQNMKNLDKVQSKISANMLTERMMNQQRLQSQVPKGPVGSGASASGAGMSASAKIAGATAAAFTLSMPIREAIAFESQMSQVRKVVDFDTPQQFKQMSVDIINMSRKLPVAAAGIAEIIAEAGQAGIAREDLKAFADDASKMSIAFDITAKEAGNSMAVWRTIFKLNQTEVRSLADQINYLSNISPVTASHLSEVVTRIGALGGLAGLSAGQVAALGAAMPGVQAEVAGTSLKKLTSVMTAGFSATKAQHSMFEALGFSAEKMAVSMQEDATGSIMALLKSIKQLPKADQMSYISELFGEEGKAGIGLLIQNLDMVADNFRDVADAAKTAGSMQKEYDSRAATSSNNLQLLKNNFAALSIALGNGFLPALNATFQPLIKVAQGTEYIITTFPGLTAGLAGAAIVAYGYSAGITAVSLATKVATLATTAFNAVVKLSPIGRGIALVTLLAGVIYELYNHFEVVRNAVDSAVDSLKRFFSFGNNSFTVSAVTEMDNGSMLPGHADGGIFNKPHIAWFAEGGVSEAAIPIDGSDRSLSIWAKAGEMLGVSPSGGGGSFAINAPFAPVLNFASGVNPAEVQQVIERERDNFRIMLEDLIEEMRRKSYA